MFELPDPKDDGLEKMPVGSWARHKHHFLRRYMDAFTVAMNKKKWSGLYYIDLFAGPGILEIENSSDLIWGSPLIAAHCSRFDGLHLCEKNKKKVEALQYRIDAVNLQDKAKVYQGDANIVVNEIVDAIPKKSLSLAFLDPSGLHLHFATLRILARIRADLIIFFPDHLDALRNWEWVYDDNPNSNLDKVLGEGADWRSIFQTGPSSGWAEKLRDLYVAQLRSLGFNFFEYERIQKGNSPLYLLIFCSRDDAGAKIWRRTSLKKPDGQRTFEF